MAGWLHAALRAVLPHVGDIIAAGKPAFTKREALPAANQDLVQQQIAELQGAVSQQSSHIKELAAQLENTVNALEKAAGGRRAAAARAYLHRRGRGGRGGRARHRVR